MLVAAGSVADAAMLSPWLQTKIETHARISNHPGQYSSDILNEGSGLLLH
jgi:hypothetical protein